MKELYELKEQLMDELKGYRGKQKKSMDDIMVIKYLSSSIDHISNIIDGGEYSNGYDDTRIYSGRTNMRNRYAMNGYSRADITEKLHELMQDAPDDRTRMEIKRIIDRM